MDKGGTVGAIASGALVIVGLVVFFTAGGLGGTIVGFALVALGCHVGLRSRYGDSSGVE